MRILLAFPLVFAAGCMGSGGSISEAPPSDPGRNLPPRLSEPDRGSAASVYRTSEYNASGALGAVRAAEGYAARPSGAAGGEGKRIAIVDTGIDVNHPEFDNARSFRFITQGEADDPRDTDGHGTHVAGIAAGRRDGVGIHGVAYNAQPIGIKVLRGAARRSDGTITATTVFGTDVALGVYSAAGMAVRLQARDSAGNLIFTPGLFGPEPLIFDSDPRAEADVINLSLGGGTDPAGVLRNAMRNAAARGKILVSAQGNESIIGPSTSGSPAAYSDLLGGHGISVVSLDASGQRLATYSNSCGNIQSCMAARGSDITSSVPGGYATTDGTSMAAPVVAGAAATALAAFPGVAPRDIVQKMFRTADDLGTPGRDPIFGFGRLNMERLLQPEGQLSVATAGTVDGPAVPVAALGASSGPLVSVTGLQSATQDMVAFDSMGFPFRIDASDQIRHRGRAQPLLDFIDRDGEGVFARAGTGDGRVMVMGWRSDQNEPCLSRQGRVSAACDDETGFTRVDAKLGLSDSVSLSFREDTAPTLGLEPVGVSAIRGGVLGSDLAFQAIPAYAGEGRELGMTAKFSETGSASVAVHRGSGYRGEADTNTVVMALGESVGPFDVAFRAGFIDESDAVGGSTFDGFMQSASGFTSFGSVDVATQLTDRVRLVARAAFATTDPVGDRGDLLRMNRQYGDAFGLGAVVERVFSSNDTLSLAASLPYAASSATGTFRSAVGRREDGSVITRDTTIDFAPEARETNVQLNYQARLTGSMLMNVSGYSRLNADNIDGETDHGVMVGLGVRF